MIRTRTELQARLDALVATLDQMALARAQPDLMWEAFELFADLPADGHLAEADRFWWSEHMFAVAKQYGLISSQAPVRDEALYSSRRPGKDLNE